MIAIYDNAGYVLMTMSNLPQPLIGINTLEVEIPVGTYITSIDVTVTPNVPVFADLPKTETQKLQEQVNDLNLAMAALIGGAV